MPKPSLPRLSTRQSGAAALLLLLMLGLGSGLLLLSAFQPLTEARRERDTIRAMQEAEEALIGFAMQNGRLPRPASVASNGMENATPCESEAACTGFLPWATLGVRGNDSWGKILRYSVTPGFANARILPYSAVADKTVLGRRTTGELYYRKGQQHCMLGAQCEPAVIISNGKRNLGTSTNGIPQANASNSNVDEIHNNFGTNQFISRFKDERSQLQGGEFDDLVVTVSLQALFRQMSAAGAFRAQTSVIIVPLGIDSKKGIASSP